MQINKLYVTTFMVGISNEVIVGKFSDSFLDIIWLMTIDLYLIEF